MAEKQTGKQGIDPTALGDVPESLHPLLQFLANNVKLLSVLGIVLVAALAGMYVYETQKARSLVEAENELGLILVQEAGEKKIQALDEFIANGNSRLKENAQLALIETCLDVGEYERAASLWQEVSANTKSAMGVVDKLGAMQALRRAGKEKEALDGLVALRAEAPKSYALLLDWEIGVLAESAGEYETAITAYQGMIEAGAMTDTKYLEDKVEALTLKLKDNG